MTTCATLTARLGDISFLNCAPIRWGLADSGAARQAELVSAPPERLAGELLSGGLDISPVSLVRYLRHADDLCLLPGIAIGSDGPVRSCHIVSRGPLDDLDGRVVALSAASRSTTALARTLLEDAVGVRPVYRSVPQDRQDGSGIPAGAAAAVLIGDDALRLYADPPRGVTVHDTGALWREWTGLPMVFAVWAVRRRFAEACPDAVREAGAALTDAVARARSHPVEVAAAAARESGRGGAAPLGPAVLLDYYRALDYSLGDRQLAAIQEFALRAAGRAGTPLHPLHPSVRLPAPGGRT
ncbi:menaquinone biosynthesis protein [Streptomyces zingiberis]|uniref:Chorismate dehydratase n=1 Tax=Streptomyces zingiberis TaxID=2053010 RepID=A0ABX1BZY6_9ACTN|nr:menaquinone biosynthesis protein [Streptomyces zingiberis]NJQ01107.1 menaquinone biosynthesis protein [Streptomyces zingiberis]